MWHSERLLHIKIFLCKWVLSPRLAYFCRTPHVCVASKVTTKCMHGYEYPIKREFFLEICPKTGTNRGCADIKTKDWHTIFNKIKTW